MPPNDYGTPTPTRTHKGHRMTLIANHAFHFISAVIVLGIAAYFIADFTSTAHLRYWVGLAAMDILLYTPALVLPAMKFYKGHYAPVALLFSYLWLIAFVFSVQDYNYGGGPWWNTPRVLGKNGLKRTLQAFAFLAFFTNLIGVCLEAALWGKITEEERDAAAAGRGMSEAGKHPAPVTTAAGGNNAPATVSV